ncbi:MAG: DUF4175 family protein [Proteobacteria bacterium]|nr:DUF4175 family protein [Pseudomonadota bacterium]
MPADLEPRSKARLNRALILARAVMLWEQTARVWAPWLLGAGVLAVAGLWGLFGFVPPMAHTAVVVVAALVALGFSVWGARGLRWPSREDAKRRLQADSALVHAPLEALEDMPAVGDPALWALHKAQAEDAIKAARVGRPKAGLAEADPYALRYALVMAAVMALWARGPDKAGDALYAFRPVTNAAHVTADAGGHAVAAVAGLFETGRPPSPVSAKAR